jgi:hypothetical protein
MQTQSNTTTSEKTQAGKKLSAKRKESMVDISILRING